MSDAWKNTYYWYVLSVCSPLLHVYKNVCRFLDAIYNHLIILCEFYFIFWWQTGFENFYCITRVEFWTHPKAARLFGSSKMQFHLVSYFYFFFLFVFRYKVLISSSHRWFFKCSTYSRKKSYFIRFNESFMLYTSLDKIRQRLLDGKLCL